jgi:hypothetical protein
LITRTRIVFTLRLLGAVLLLAAGTRSFADPTFTVTPTSSGCQLLSAPAGTLPAFCETFDAPAGTGNRSGQLNGTLWGVSRLLGSTNSGQNQYFDVAATTIQLCGASLQVIDPNDVQICGGQLVESVWDQTGVTSLAMYPKQPFDISGGRTGTIAFDVSDDSNGNHSVWPELWWADQPVPVPFVHESSLQSVPANGFGVRFAGVCEANSGPGCGARGFCPAISEDFAVVTVDSAVVINNYVSNDSFDPVGSISVQPVNCVIRSSGPGNMNHFELRVSQNEIDVYGTDAGTTGPLKKIAIISNMTLSMTRGVVYLEDVHYNANKGVDSGPPQGIHTFTWDNLAFDGPTLPRDLAFDVADALTPVGSNYPGILNTGWPVSPTDSAPLTLTVPGVYNIANAVDAILTFNFVDFNAANLFTPAPFISYRVNNGTPQLAPWPFGPCPVQNSLPACGVYTIAVPILLSDVQSGSNTIQFTATDYAAIANVDLILRGAAGNACTTNCPVATATTLTSSANPSNVGSTVTLSAKVASSGSTPTGTVTFSDSGATLGTVALNSSGVAIFATSSLSAGTHVLAATYSGASGFSPSGSPSLTQVVNAVNAVTTTVLSSSANPSNTGSSVTFTATISSSAGMPSGNVTFNDSGTPLGTVALSGSGVATFAISSLTAGTHTITASYSGASGFAASTSPALSQVVNSTTAVQFNWEDGKVDGWQVAWGKALTIANSTTEAFSGAHSLKLSITSAETHSAVDNETSSELTAFTPGTTVTFHVFNSGMSGITALLFAYDEVWIPFFGSGVALQPGWNTMTYLIPAAFHVVNGIGLQVNLSNPQTGSLYLDAISATH